MPAIANAPTQGPPSRGDAWLIWAIFLAAVALLVSRPWQTSAVPAASDLRDSEFSAERAWPHVEALATRIGRRVTGTDASARAADYIEHQLRSLGLEPERQIASGTIELEATVYVYRGVQNVLARVTGRNRAAILVSAHYDSAVEGPGAGDNALNVAAALEIARATLASGIPANTIIFGFIDGEERGLLGAEAFVHHPWFEEVAAFVNLDASGAGGRQLMLQVTPGRDDLVEAYAATARHVHGTILAQEIFQVLPFDTDYHVYRDAGLGGLDLAPYGDGYAYHTPLDRTERLSRRTLQESGENVLALLRGMEALSPARRHQLALPRPEVALPATYYDLLGVVMVRYSAGTARSIGLLVVVLALVLVWRDGAGTRRLFSMALGTAAVGFSACLGVLGPIVGSVLVTAAGHTMFWYARPWTALCVYGTLAAAAVLMGHAVLRAVARRRAVAAAQVWGCGLVVCWALMLLTATALRLGSGYLALWWCVGATVALVASTHLTGLKHWVVTLAGFAPAAITTMQAADLLLTSMVPVSGMLGAGKPADALIAAITSLAVAPFALMVAPVIQAAPSRRQVGAWSVAMAAMMVLLVAYSFPYTPERPKRAYIDVRVSGEDGAHAVIEAIDSGPGFAIREVGLDATIRRSAPAIEVLPATAAGSPEPHILEMRLRAPGAYMVDVTLEGGTISRPGGRDAGTARHLIWVGTDDALTIRVARTAGSAVDVHAQAFFVGSDIPVDHVLAQLPRWSAATVETILETSASF